MECPDSARQYIGENQNYKTANKALNMMVRLHSVHSSIAIVARVFGNQHF